MPDTELRSKLHFSDNGTTQLADALDDMHADRLFVLCDETTHKLCLPLVDDVLSARSTKEIVIPQGDINKNINTLSSVWQALQDGGATRHSVLVCLGGGMVTDLGGFAAATFKRGIRFINMPTTLLSMVDASVGGKTGVNFGGLKNEIGAFRNAESVIIDTRFLRTLDNENLYSGYAEMLKHGLISEATAHLDTLLATDPTRLASDAELAARLLQESVAVKERVVEADPEERGLRKVLNFGHTFGHAFESHTMNTGHPMLHGRAVAFGMVCELYLSVVLCGFPASTMRRVVGYIREHYGILPLDCRDYPTLVALMHHDKKNVAGHINFSLLADVGKVRLDSEASQNDITEALDFLRDGL